jgi:hypothetical protein
LPASERISLLNAHKLAEFVTHKTSILYYAYYFQATQQEKSEFLKKDTVPSQFPWTEPTPLSTISKSRRHIERVSMRHLFTPQLLMNNGTIR